MLKRYLIVGAVLIAVASAGTMDIWAQRGRGANQAAAEKPTASVRFGQWQNEGNANNVMTYEPWGDGGMKITVSNPQDGSSWSYETLFDGKFRPVTGQENAETAVEFIDARSTRIQNKRGGRVTQIVINTLSEDGKSINNEYIRFDAAGKITGVSHVTYRRIK